MLVAPGIPFRKLVASQMNGTKDDMGCIVQGPVLVKQPSLTLELSKKRSSGIGRENVKRRAFEPIRFDPLDRAREDIGTILVKTQDEAPVDLDAVVVEHGDAPRIVGHEGGLLVGVSQVSIGKRLKADEHPRASSQSHLMNQ